MSMGRGAHTRYGESAIRKSNVELFRNSNKPFTKEVEKINVSNKRKNNLDNHR